MPVDDRALASAAAEALRRVVDRPRRADPRRDGLTGLFDNRTLHRALTRMIRTANRRGDDIGLLFLDLDRFKRVNDRHGHVTGSRILSQVARLIGVAARQAGGFAARYGGDEFVVVLPGVDLDLSLRQAENLRAALEATILAGGQSPRRRPLVRVTCTIGAASLRQQGGDDGALSPERAATRMLQQADNAMYAAKHAGRNRVAAADASATGAA